MFDMIRRMLLVFAPLFLMGCEEATDLYYSVRYPHSTTLVTRCMDRNRAAAEQLRLDVRTYCAREHSTNLSWNQIDGRGEPYCVGNVRPTRAFRATINNKSEDRIATRLSISVQSQGNWVSSYPIDVWIPPRQSEAIIFFMRGEISCAREPPTQWQFESMRGLNVVLR